MGTLESPPWVMRFILVVRGIAPVSRRASKTVLSEPTILVVVGLFKPLTCAGDAIGTGAAGASEPASLARTDCGDIDDTANSSEIA